MRAGDRYRLAGIGLGAALCFGAVLSALSALTGALPAYWVLPLTLLLAAATVFASGTLFGITWIERLAARKVHGGRHYYYENTELAVRVGAANIVWVRLREVVSIVGGDEGVAKHYPAGAALCFEDEPEVFYLSFAGMRRYLGNQRGAGARKFSLWFERQLVRPMEERARRRLPVYGTGEHR